MNSEEQQYLNLINNLMNKGHYEKGRNGFTYSIFGYSMRFSLENQSIPILTTKKLSWKTCLKELLWFVRGQTDNKILNSQGVKIWDGNSSAKYLESRGLDYEEGLLGPIYGFQWRQFNGDYKTQTGGIDQLQEIIDLLKNPETRNSRRLILTAWNPLQLDEMALPPCHILCQFNVHDGNKLSCAMYQRSGDVGLGVPFNIASYSFLTHLIAKHCDMEPFEFVYFIGNAHIYEEHIEVLKSQLNRDTFSFPKLIISSKYEKIEDYQVEDFNIIDYTCHESLNMKMIT
jgi:thymidylate synthase